MRYLFYFNKNRTGYVPFRDASHFKLCLQSVLPFGRINYNVKWALEKHLESKGKRTKRLEMLPCKHHKVS